MAKEASEKKIGFFENFQKQVSKIVWPSKEDLIKQTKVVIEFVLLMAALVWVADIVFNYISTIIN